MTACFPEDEPLTPEWRADALYRLFRGVKTASKDSGTSLRDCLVPVEATDPTTGELIAEKNTYQKVRIMGRNYQAHVAVLMLVHNRHAIRNRGKEHNEVGMHLCNNPACRNPAHLKFGTSREDSAYKVACGRAPSGDLNGHSTMPDRTPRGDGHYNTRLKGERRVTAIELIKKYGHLQGYAPAIAEFLGCTLATIHELKRKGAHLNPEVKESEIELTFSARPTRKARSAIPKKSADVRRRIAGEIRRRFNDAPLDERSGLLLQFEAEYGFTGASIRNILKREIYPDVAPEIPIPTEWGIGRRKSFKQRRRQGDSK